MHRTLADSKQFPDLPIGEAGEIAELHDGLEPRRLLTQPGQRVVQRENLVRRHLLARRQSIDRGMVEGPAPLSGIPATSMESRQNRDRVLQELRSHLGRDRARTKAFAVSELGLIEMTRQRVRPSLWHSMTTECPSCAGTGRVFTPEAVARRLERSLKRAGRERRERQIAVRLHPDVALYLLEEEPKLIHTLGKATGLELELRDDPMSVPGRPLSTRSIIAS